MHILDLPPELLDNILYFSILSRTVPRALRLKLVCKSFYRPFKHVLFQTKVMDEALSHDTFREWHTGRFYGSHTLWHDYLVFRCRSETDPSVGRFLEIRNVADALLRQCEVHGEREDLDFEAILDGLCWLALERGTKYPGRRQGWDSHCGRENEAPNPGLNLLAAATYFGCTAVVRDLLSQGYCPTKDNDLFPSAMYLAAWTGQAAMLEFLQESLPDLEDYNPTTYWAEFRAKIGPGSLRGAAMRGDLEMLRLALYPPSRTIPPPDDNEIDNGGDPRIRREKKGGSDKANPNSMLVLGEKPGQVPNGSKLAFHVAWATRLATSPAVFDYLKAFMGPIDTLPTLNDNELAIRAGTGNMAMVRHLLDKGAHPTAKEASGGPALARAIRNWHVDVVDLLLARGADPNERGKYRRGTVMTAAAKAGSMMMLRKLIDAGVSVGPHDGWTLRHAVKLEHTAMAELLLSMGVGKERARRSALEMARELGMDSMVELLEPWVKVSEPSMLEEELLL